MLIFLFPLLSNKKINKTKISENCLDEILNDSMNMDSHDISNDSIGEASNDTEKNIINLKKIKKEFFLNKINSF